MAQEHLAGSPGELVSRILTLIKQGGAQPPADPVPAPAPSNVGFSESGGGAATGAVVQRPNQRADVPPSSTPSTPGVNEAIGMGPISIPLRALQMFLGRMTDDSDNRTAAMMGRVNPTPDRVGDAMAVNAGRSMGGVPDVTGALSRMGSAAANAYADAQGWKPAQGAMPTPVPAPQPGGQPAATPTPPAPAAQPQQTAPQGALPAGPRRRPAAAKPGALPMATPPAGTMGLTDYESPENVTVDQPSQPAEKTTPKSQISYGDRYREGLKGIPSADASPMSDQQRNNALLEAGLAIMAASAKPGAYALGAVGEGGQKGTAAMREYEKQNREDALRRRTEARDDLKSGIGFDEKDADRDWKERDMVERITDRRERTKHEGQRIDLLQKQIEEAGWTIEDGPNGRRVAVRARTGETRELPLRNKPERNANVEFYSWLMADPKRQELFLKEKTDKGMTERQLVDQYIEAHKASAGLGGPQKTTEEVMNDAIRWARSQRGATNSGGGATNTPVKPATELEAHTQARAAVEQGKDKNLINQRLQSWGYKPI